MQRRRWRRAREPVFVPATAETGFLPDYRQSLPNDMLERMAAVYICSPSNPEGAWRAKTIGKHCSRWPTDTISLVLADECYADIYFDKPPRTALPRALAAEREFRPAAHLSFAVQTLGPAGLALRHGGGRCRS